MSRTAAPRSVPAAYGSSNTSAPNTPDVNPDGHSTQAAVQETRYHATRIGAPEYLSALEDGAKEPGSAVLPAISREFGKSVDWLLIGEEKE